MAVEHAASHAQHWPAVALAYEFVRPSYDIMLKRFEIAEGRIRALLTLSASLTFGAPVFASAVRGQGALAYDSLWLLLALSCAGFILIAGALGSVGRRVDVPSPALIAAAATQHGISVWDFQRYALQGAETAWEANRHRLEWKARLGDAMAVALIVEVALMVAWVVVG